MSDNLRKALFILLYDLTDIGDLEIDSDDYYFIETIIEFLIGENKDVCPFKNYSAKGCCKNFSQCRQGFLKLDCGKEAKEVWKEFMGIKD